MNSSRREFLIAAGVATAAMAWLPSGPPVAPPPVAAPQPEAYWNCHDCSRDFQVGDLVARVPDAKVLAHAGCSAAPSYAYRPIAGVVIALAHDNLPPTLATTGVCQVNIQP